MSGVTATHEGRGAARVPVRRLTVLYDAECSLCAFVRDWLVRQPQLVPLELVPAASEAARARFPGLDHGSTLEEITVVGDAGQVYRGAAAWVDLSGLGGPDQVYWDVDFVDEGEAGIARFATYGRGIWDFVLAGDGIFADGFEAD